jgi:hypothetical protein
MTDINENEFAEEYDGQGEDAPQPRPVARVIPIGEAETGDTITDNEVSYTRQVNLGSRDDNAWFRMSLRFPTQPGWEMDQIAVQGVAYFNTVVSVVCEQAGLPVFVTESGVVREAIHTLLPGAEEVQEDRPAPRRRQERSQPSRRASSGGGGRGRNYPPPSEIDKPDHIDAEDWDDLCSNPDDWYDNRADKAKGIGHPQGPDFRHKQDGTGLWMRPYQPSGRGRGR